MPKRHAPYLEACRSDAIALVRRSGKSIAEVAVDLGISSESLRKWEKPAKIDAGEGPRGALTTEEREELRRLRREKKTLLLEREILRKAAAFFAWEALLTACGLSTLWGRGVASVSDRPPQPRRRLAIQV